MNGDSVRSPRVGKWVSRPNHERKSNPKPNPNPNPNPDPNPNNYNPNHNPTLTDHPDLTLSIFPSLHSDRRSDPIIVLRFARHAIDFTYRCTYRSARYFSPPL